MAKIKIQKTETIYILSLSKDEVSCLITILENIGGSPSTTRRHYSDSILNAINNVDVTVNYNDIKGTLYFIEND